mmetsp:Transcript_21816/g.61753  ORF Transcript_21816/g.61753 Transcript_21816/m.61753 type:complete len:209 (-) Transcript_21816:130-756(-)
MPRPQVGIPGRGLDERAAMASVAPLLLGAAGVLHPVPVVRVHELAVLYDRGDQVVHVSVHHGLHEDLGLGHRGVTLPPPHLVEAVGQAPQLLQQVAHHAPVRVPLRVLRDLRPHPAQVPVGELRGRRRHAPNRPAVKVHAPHVPLVLRHALVRQGPLQVARGVALLLARVPLGGVDVEHRPTGALDLVHEAAPGRRARAVGGRGVRRR